MNKSLQNIGITILAFFLLLGFFVQRSKAGTQAIEGFSLNAIVVCLDGFVYFNYDYLPSTSNIATHFRIDIYPISTTFRIAASQGANITGNLAVGAQVEGDSLSVDIIAENNGTGIGGYFTGTMVMDCSTNPPPTVGNPSSPYRELLCHQDGRLDVFNCVAPVAIYLGQDSDGWTWQIW